MRFSHGHICADQPRRVDAGGTAVETLRVAEGKISPFNGMIYVQATDIQASCRKVNQLRRTVVPGFPFNLPDGTGAIAVAVDPAGHPVGLYSRTPLSPAPSPTR
jgi:predicted enzyme related to lactoylglutathione lyase